MPTTTTPSSLLSLPWGQVTAKKLSISDQHVNILLTHHENAPNGNDNNGNCDVETASPSTFQRSLFKLSLVPLHRSALENNGDQNTDNEDDEKISLRILQFLSGYEYRLTSESGAEYSFYDAYRKRRPTFRLIATPFQLVGSMVHASFQYLFQGLFLLPALLLGWNQTTSFAVVAPRTFSSMSTEDDTGTFRVELISPASDRQIRRCSPSPAVVLVEETVDMYQEVTLPYIAKLKEGNSLAWIQNVVEGKKERERLLFDHEEYIINIDTKWKSHLNPSTTSRSEWYQHSSTRDLYCLGIVKSKEIATLRDLHGRHVPLLKSMLHEGRRVIGEVYGVAPSELRVFVHYPPQFYHFHVHYTRLKSSHDEQGVQVERAHLLNDIVQNLQLDSDFYRRRTISYRLPITDPLHAALKDHGTAKTNETDSAV